MKNLPGNIDVLVCDVVLRDGLQILKNYISFDDKKAILNLLVSSGIRNVEVTSMVPASVVPQFGDASEMISYANTFDDVLATVLVPNLKGAERATLAGAASMVVPMSASETHSNKNLRKSREAQVAELREIRDLIDSQSPSARPLLAVGIATAFGCSYEGRIAEDEVFKVVDQCLEVGVDEIGLADTVGYAVPSSVFSAFKRLNHLVMGTVRVRAHFHNTFGFGLANVYAALEADVKIFDASLCGLGGCPFAPDSTGNITLEDLVLMIQKMGLYTGIDLDRLLAGQDLLRTRVADARLHGYLNAVGTYPADFIPEQTPAAVS